MNLWQRWFGRRAPPAPTAGVQIEGHGRTVRVAPFTYAAALPKQNHLVVSSSASGALASAHVATEGPAVATRPGGPVSEAGIESVTAGPEGDWHVHLRGVRFRWPNGVLLRFPPDDHPGDLMPLYLAKSVDTDEMVTLFGVFEAPPDPLDFVAPGQEVLRSEVDQGTRVLELRYVHGGEHWHQWLYWSPECSLGKARSAGGASPAMAQWPSPASRPNGSPLASGFVVVKAQELEGQSAGLAAIARDVARGLAR